MDKSWEREKWELQARTEIEPKYLKWLKSNYFSDSKNRIILKKGEYLLKEGEANNKLFLIISGKLNGYMKDPDGAKYNLFTTAEGQFVGLLSFFSEKLDSHSTVVALEDSEVAFITNDAKPVEHETSKSLFEQFLPVVISNLAFRRRHEQRVAWERSEALKKLAESEKRISLGEMAEGLAHELNNAISVLERNASWVSSMLTKISDTESKLIKESFLFGSSNGRNVSSLEARKRIKELEKKFRMSKTKIRHIAETGFSDSFIKELLKRSEEEQERIFWYWDLGATLHSSRLASRHASHVVKSIRILGARDTKPEKDVDVNNTIDNAIELLRSNLKKVNFKKELNSKALLELNPGDMVQVWLNLIKNAVESLENTKNPSIFLKSEEDSNFVIVSVRDNGPGIPKELQKKVFKPNFSTKEKGLTFGLGLGLTICSTIVSTYDGKIKLYSNKGCTEFSVFLPKVRDLHKT